MTDPGLIIIIGNTIGGGVASSILALNIISEVGDDIITQDLLNIITQ